MGVSLVRYKEKSGSVFWGALKEGRIVPVEEGAGSLSVFLRSGGKERARTVSGPLLSLESVELLSPVTSPCQIICQGKNYLDHVIETGVKPKNKDFNLLFAKADSSLAPAVGRVVRPEGIRLLDYELELGLVVGREVTKEEPVTEENLHEFVAGFVMANDLSARDVQIPERQWFKGKSFRGFCPVGPVLFLPDEDEFSFWSNLDLELKVNGKVRQRANTRQLLHRPAETLREISRIFDLRVGDLLLTGTPGGVAMKVRTKKLWEEFRDLFKTDREKFAAFIEEQAASGRYLQNGDLIESSIHSQHGGISLGEQRLRVEASHES